MKRIIILILITLLCGCESRILKDEATPVEYVTKLVELGYSQDAAQIADYFNDELKTKLLNNYDSNIEKLLSQENINEDIINCYLNNTINIDLLIDIINDHYYVNINLDLYGEYQNDFTDARSLVEYVNSKAYKKPYIEYEDSDISKDLLMIASKIYYLNDYVPDDLVDVEEEYYVLDQPQLRSVAYTAYKEMVDEARKDNIYFYISTAYRSYDFQNTLYNNYLKVDDQEVVDTYSSRPGFSDHQIGLSVDLRTKEKAFDDFVDTKEAIWLKENAYKYGFIQRYPEGKENITGYMAEAWHYRYVGKSIAEEIFMNNITFDEYYGFCQ